MQDSHSIGGTPFTGNGGADRRMRPNQNNMNRPANLKCPRCESANTKFCYYNNYNLSQPRHFCKGCRRYWTKGGLLRNVPVGGGNRKPKRSSKPKVTPATLPVNESEGEKEEGSSNSYSTSENSSSITAVTGVNTEDRVFNRNENCVRDENNDGGACFEQTHLMDSESGIFSGIGNFTRRDETMSFGFNGQGWPRQQKMESDDYGGGFHFQGLITAGLFDQTDEFYSLQNKSTVNNNYNGSGGCEPLDWQGVGNYNGEQSVFDCVDKAHWSQTQWTTNDQDYSSTLYLS